jgi:hypothetical protein
MLGAGGAIYISLRNSKKIEVVHKATNSMKDELVEAVRLAAHAKGIEDERANFKRRKPKGV